jgi:hypothetical protein
LIIGFDDDPNFDNKNPFAKKPELKSKLKNPEP